MEKVFLGLTWKDEDTPLFHIKTPNSNKDEYIFIPKMVNLKNLGVRTCIGTTNPNTMEYLNCNNHVDLTQCQCNRCKFMYEFYKCVRCHGDECIIKDKNSKEYCNSSHLVYLAYFPQDKIKVGTASEKRKDVRLLEQGALYATYIAKAPTGQIARQIEKAIINYGVTGLVTTAYKMKNIQYLQDDVQINRLLIDKYNEIKETLPETYKSYLINPHIVNYPKIIKQLIDFRSGNGLATQQIRQDYVVSKDMQNINGDYAFAVGKILALQTENGIELFDTKRFEGYTFDFDNKMEIKLYFDRGEEYEK